MKRAWGGRAGVALAVVLAGTAAGAAPALVVGDIRVIEGSPSGFQDHLVTISLTEAGALPVDATWTAVSGSALGGGVDFVTAVPYGGGTVHFDAGETAQTVTVRVVLDMAPEWSPTARRDEVFFVDVSSPVNATVRKGRGTVTILDDDRAEPGVQLVSAVSDGTAVAGRNRLQWRVPPAPDPPTGVLVAWNSGPACAFPVDSQAVSAEGQATLPAALPGETQTWTHLEESVGVPLVPTKTYCYSLFAVYTGPTVTTERVTIKATPFDASGQVKWSYATGWPDLVPPTVGSDAVYTVSTDGVVHAMDRGDTGGTWPPGWNPVALGKPAHARSAAVPLAGGVRLLVGTEDGEVHAVDAKSGTLAWSRSQPFGNTQLPSTGGAQAAPAALLEAYGGLNDLVLVGTNTVTASEFFALDPGTGADRDSYTSGAMGSIKGMAAVDYAANRVHFLTAASGATLWTLDLGPAGAPNLTPPGLPGGNPRSFSGANGSPVLRNGRVYFGTVDSLVRVVRLSDGMAAGYGHGNGEAKGFVFPDRRNGAFYFSTDGKVWAVTDTVEPASPGLTPLWTVTDIPTPSIVLHRPGTDLLYVGGGDGRLYTIDVASADPEATKQSVLLESGAQIGAPSLDVTHDLVLVGSASGVVYAVRP
jgi:outer membrane protein assembly factor BamB